MSVIIRLLAHATSQNMWRITTLQRVKKLEVPWSTLYKQKVNPISFSIVSTTEEAKWRNISGFQHIKNIFTPRIRYWNDRYSLAMKFTNTFRCISNIAYEPFRILIGNFQKFQLKILCNIVKPLMAALILFAAADHFYMCFTDSCCSLLNEQASTSLVS